MPNIYEGFWTQAKATYRADSGGSKKPAEKRFLGLFGDLFRTSTGIGDACKLVDKAFANVHDKKSGLVTDKGLDAIEAAIENYVAVKDTYLVRLDREIAAEGAKIAAALETEAKESRKSLTLAEKKKDAKAIAAAEKAVAEADKNKAAHEAALKAAKSKESALSAMKRALNQWPNLMTGQVSQLAREKSSKGEMSPQDILKAYKLAGLKDSPDNVIGLSTEIEKACAAIVKAKPAADQLRLYSESLYGGNQEARMRRLGAQLVMLKDFYDPAEQKNWQKVFDRYGNADGGKAKAIEAKDVAAAAKEIAKVVAETKEFGKKVKKMVARG